jgi:tetratricopeptide (TPR) repeat protein/energy-coupling factor transporter ATP-binding protein EcfA2
LVAALVSGAGREGENSNDPKTMSLVAHKYTPAEISPQELEATFAARGHTVDYLLDSLRMQIKSGTLSSFLITGPRGSGKSTIIQMVALRIRQDSKLNAAWIPVVFPEEQFNIGSVRDLMAATLQMLAKQEISPAKAWLEKVEAEANEEQSLQLALTGLREITRQQRKRLILFIENLNQLLEECFDDRAKATFRRLLMSDPFMMVIGSAVHVFESLKSYDEAFFNYFGQVPLGRLSAEEVFDLLRLRAMFDGNQDFLRELPSQQSKVRAIVLLSGGNPRLILMLYELLTQRQVTTIVQCLRRLVDELTPLLKHEIENLPPQQRLIINALMEKGGAAQPTELVARTRLPLNAITTQLGRLKDAQFVEVLGGGKGRTANYTVPDKLFAIWYQMRYLGKNRRRIELFVEVLRVWFEEEERLATLRNLASPVPSGAAQVLRDAATTAEYFAASFKGTLHERLATELCVYHWALTDLREAALAYADLSNAGKEKSVMDEIQAYTGLGDLLFQHGDFQHAIQSLDEVIAKHPGNVKALNNRGVAKGRSDDMKGAISDFTTVIELEDAPKEQVAIALVNRGFAMARLGNTTGEISDYTTAIELKDSPKEQVAVAFVNRSFAKERLGDIEGAMSDCTAVVELENAPKEQVAIALLNRSSLKGRMGDIQGAMSDCMKLIEMEGAPNEQIAFALFNRGIAKGLLGDHHGAISDYTSMIGINGISKEQFAWALVNRGGTKGKLNDTQGEISDYTTLIEMKDAPTEGVARALFNRGVAKGGLSDRQGAISDYTTVIEMKSVPTEIVARALVNRGSLKSQLGDNRAAIADHTAVIEMEGAPKEQVASALVNRTVANGQLGDMQGVISDYTAMIEMVGISKQQLSRALFHRGLTFHQQGKTSAAIEDLLKVIDLAEMTEDLMARATMVAYGVLWHRKDYSGAKAVVTKLCGVLKSAPKEFACATVLGFLYSIAVPTMNDAWLTAWHVLAETQRPEIVEALQFLEPVCAVLEGKERTVLDGLPPEQREFAENVLKSFDAKPK